MKRPRNPATGARSELTFTQAYRAGCRRGESRKLRQHCEPHTRSAEQTMSVRKLSPHTPVGTPSLTCMLGTSVPNSKAFALIIELAICNDTETTT